MNEMTRHAERTLKDTVAAKDQWDLRSLQGLREDAKM